MIRRAAAEQSGTARGLLGAIFLLSPPGGRHSCKSSRGTVRPHRTASDARSKRHAKSAALLLPRQTDSHQAWTRAKGQPCPGPSALTFADSRPSLVARWCVPVCALLAVARRSMVCPPPHTHTKPTIAQNAVLRDTHLQLVRETVALRGFGDWGKFVADRQADRGLAA